MMMKQAHTHVEPATEGELKAMMGELINDVMATDLDDVSKKIVRIALQDLYIRVECRRRAMVFS
jgi:hypothetical protein